MLGDTNTGEPRRPCAAIRESSVEEDPASW